MYEKNREASALAAISRAIAGQQKDGLQNTDTSTKPPRESRSDDAPPITLKTKRKKEEKLKAAAEQTSGQIEVEKGRKKKKEKSAEKSRIEQQNLDEIEPPSSLATPPPLSNLPSTANAFRDWYLTKLADTFEAEIEGINDADAPVGSKVLLQALESNLALFSEQECRVALAAQGIQTKN